MQTKTFDEWRAIYEEKTGDKFIAVDGFTLFYIPDRGFADMKIDEEGKIINVNQVCGDAKFFRDLAEIIGKAFHCIAIGTICTRHIEPYLRSFGAEILTSFTNKDTGQKRYICQDNIGRKVIVTYQCQNAKDEPQYFVTHYFFEKASLDDNIINELAPKAVKEDNEN